MAHVPWRDELALLDVDGAAGFAGGHQQIGLAAEKGGNLEDVDGFGGDLAMAGLMDISEDRQARVFGDAGEDARPLLEAGSAKALDAGAIGLVVAGFEDIRDADIGCDALDSFGNGARMGLGLDDAGTGDEEELARADLHGADFKGFAHERDFNAVVSDQCSVISSAHGVDTETRLG